MKIKDAKFQDALLNILEDLKESEAKYKEIYENVNDVIIYVNVFGKVIEVNNKVYDVFGYKQKEVIGKSFFKFNFIKDLKSLIKIFKDIVKTGKAAKLLELEVKHKKGHLVKVEISSQIVKRKGKIEGFLSVVRDITERKKSEELIQTQESLLRTTLESTADGILVVDENGKVILTNKRFAEMWKIPQKIINTNDDKKLLKSILNQLINPKLFLKKVKKLYASKEESFDILHFKDGRVFERLSAPLIQNNNIKGRVWNFRDVTKREKAEKLLKKYSEDLEKKINQRTKQLIKQNYDVVKKSVDLTESKNILEQRTDELEELKNNLEIQVNKRTEELNKKIKLLKESEKRFYDVALISADWIWQIDENNIYTYASGKVKELLGYSPEEIIGKTPFDLMPKEEAKRAMKIFNELKTKKEKITNLVNTNLTKSGKKITLLTNGVPLIDKKGKIIGYRGIDKDISDIKKKEERIEKLEAVEEASSVRKNFLLLVTHELKQPLTPIMGYADLLKDEIFDVEKLKYLDRIITGAEEMYELITKIINLMRLETGQLMFNYREVSLKKLIDEVIRKKVSLINLRDLIIETKITDEKFIADYALIRDVILNLVDNAIKFSKPKDTILIKSESNQKFIKISVKDNGIGIKKEDISNLFKTFSQTIEGRKKGGFGIGLALCKMIVEKHKGEISVKSTLGKGSTFIIKIPRGKKE